MLRTKIFRGFVLVITLFAVLSGIVGVRMIKKRIMDEAQTRVRLDLSSAWAVFNSRQNEIEITLRMLASKQSVVDVAEGGKWDSAEIAARLDRVRVSFGLDYLGLLSPSGEVMLRSAPPKKPGGHRSSNPVVMEAMQGRVASGVNLLSQYELLQEGEHLPERALLELESTPKARETSRRTENRGMVMEAAAPILSGGQVVGIAYGGMLLNRNHDIIDRVHNVVYRDENYRGKPLGSATIFLNDCRIATTVRRQSGNRALGTRVSKEVADRVLDNGRSWLGDAFVVNTWYLSAYDPLRDPLGRVIGMLYVGVLKQPFVDDIGQLTLRYIGVTVFVLIVGLLIAFVTADRLSRPIHRLVAASNRMIRGDQPEKVNADGACSETEQLVHAFNAMTCKLHEREQSLKATNRSYMETVGYVSHELKSPVASIMNYVYLLRGEKLGPLTEKQHKAVRVIDDASQRLVEMVRHYLNLARIENGDLAPIKTKMDVADDVLDPMLDSFDSAIKEKQMKLENRVPNGILIEADSNMVREVFENMVSNAVKYGKEGGIIKLYAEEPADGMVKFHVWNEGEGISAENRDNLFRKFSRLEGQTNVKRQRGTGLGLFISRNIVETHGGSIDVASEPGQWTDFYFTFPLFEEKAKEKE